MKFKLIFLLTWWLASPTLLAALISWVGSLFSGSAAFSKSLNALHKLLAASNNFSPDVLSSMRAAIKRTSGMW